MLSRTICNQSSGKGLNWLEVIGPNRPRPDGKGSSHLYEYGWTLGYRIQPVPTHHSSILNHLETANWHEAPAEQVTGACVSLYLPTWSHWNVIAHTATVRHLSPVEHEEQWRQRLAADWSDLAPVVNAAGQATADITGLAPIGAVTKAVASLRATSVPQTPDTLWYIRSINFSNEDGLYQGVEWELPRTLLTEVGTQISGSLLVSFTETSPPGSGSSSSLIAPDQQNPPILANATLMAGETTLDRLPTNLPFVKLCLPATPETRREPEPERAASDTS